MFFRNIIFSAMIAGLIAGSIYGIFQQSWINPIIYAAEKYEVADSEGATDSHDGHGHDHGGWGPGDGSERILYTMGANALIGISVAIVLIALMSLHNLKSTKPGVNLISGLGWGLAAMLTLFVSPALFGLHPEVPGTQAAGLEYRQMWWTLCVIATALGLAVLYYAPMKFKVGGLILIVLPHLIGAPQPAMLSFANTDPAAVAALTDLSQQFFVMTTIGMLIFYLLLGGLSGWMTNRFINPDSQV